MTLILDDYNGVYVWVDVDDHNNELSPHFDYEEDAIQWYGRVSAHILDEFDITNKNDKVKD
jgi:hypothetical protein